MSEMGSQYITGDINRNIKSFVITLLIELQKRLLPQVPVKPSKIDTIPPLKPLKLEVKLL